MSGKPQPIRSIRTRTVHHPSPETGPPPLTTPICQSSTFRFADAVQAAHLAEKIHPSTFYSRYGNPTTQVLENVLADLEGAPRGLAFTSGMAAISTTLLALLQSGDHVVAGSCLYTATTELLSQELTRLQVTVTFVDPTDPANFEHAANDRTRLFYLESPNNPRMMLTDLHAVAAFARSRGIITVADNTFASPYNQRPIEHGIDIVVHSATKYLSGHSDVLAGCVLTDDPKADRIWQMQKLLGGCLDPHAAWLVLRGVKTLAVRLERQNENALAIAHALEDHPAVARVLYPGLKTHPQHELARKQMTGFGGMLSFEVKGGRPLGIRLVESTNLVVLTVSLGGVETLIEHPASMSHAALSDDELLQADISPGLIRLSVGIEDANDLINDLHAALDQLA